MKAVYKVPAATAQAAHDKFRFTIGGKAFTMPSSAELIPVDELIDLMSLDAAQQNVKLMQVFAKNLPVEARKAFKTKEQMIATLQAWYADGNGASVGESQASAD